MDQRNSKNKKKDIFASKRKEMKKVILISTLLVSALSFSQNYSTAIGIKSGYPGYGSLNLKKFTGSDFAFDVLGGWKFNSSSSSYIWAQCLFEKNKNIVNTSGANWYYGAGPAVGLWTVGGYTTKKGKYHDGIWLGLDAVIGIEYTFSAIPLNIAIEAGPSVNVFPYVGVDGLGNIALRYAIQ